MNRRYALGVTLIELMIVIVIVAILGTVAAASYRSYLVRTNRAEAKAALLRIQVAQEKFFLQNNRYVSSTADLDDAPPAGLGITTTTGNGMYAITLDAGSSDTEYTAIATAIGTQLAEDANCAVYTIDETGFRTPTASTGCWR